LSRFLGSQPGIALAGRDHVVEGEAVDRRKLLLIMLDAFHVDTVEENVIVAIRPKPAFRALFEVAKTREGSDVVLINEPPGS